MRMLFRAVAVLVVGSVPLAGVAAKHEVKMLNQGEDGVMVFEPGYLRAEIGDTVTFVPTDPAHNSVSDAIPDGARAWNGGLNEPVTVKLEKEGIYLYKCTPHLPLGMVGVIQVGKPINMDRSIWTRSGWLPMRSVRESQPIRPPGKVPESGEIGSTLRRADT